MKRLQGDFEKAWNTSGQALQAIAVLLLSALIGLLLLAAWFVEQGRDWVEGGCRPPEWMKFGKIVRRGDGSAL
ncbi:MAG TPA: hypothetical protein VKY85_07735 [Candidatus Angelobacter sp.]|nr:hypothetical protein [Candidatus Angelobacter sp.]